MKLTPFTITRRGLTCLRCGHQWLHKIPDVKICAKCKSARWNEPKKRKASQ